MSYLKKNQYNKVSNRIDEAHASDQYKKELKKILLIVKEIVAQIDVNTDVLWTEFENANELVGVLNKKAKQLKQGDLSKLEEIKFFFLPTSVLQEVAVSNGWESLYLSLASKFDRHYTKITNTYDYLILYDDKKITPFKKIKKIWNRIMQRDS
jgi:hypothetical protein